MSTTAVKLVRRSLDQPDETRPFEGSSGRVQIVNVEEGAVGKGVFEPGWRWSQHVKPIAGTESCQAAHMGYVISGRMKVVMDDGTTEEFEQGDLMICPPGHDAWTVGEQACVIVDWTGVANYAKR